jgi:transposase
MNIGGYSPQAGFVPAFEVEEPTVKLPEDADLHHMRVDLLRAAIRNNNVSFPSQIPTFERHDRPDLQRGVVQLYFTLGWSCEKIAARYGMLRQRVGQILRTWKRRALETGYIQTIPSFVNPPWNGVGIHVVLSAVVSNAPGASGRTESKGDAPRYRPRRKVDDTRVGEALKQLANGAKTADVAAEVGVSRQTVCSWKSKYGTRLLAEEEVRSLKDENKHLKRMLADLDRGQPRTRSQRAL